MTQSENPPAMPHPLPYQFALRHGIVALSSEEHDSNKTTHLYLRNGSSPMALMEVHRVMLGASLVCHNVDAEDFNQMLTKAYEHNAHRNMQMIESMEQNIDLTHLVETLPDQTDLLEWENIAPVISLINALLTEAIKQNASDIHIEPSEQQLNVRFRVDGVLRHIIQLKRTLAPVLISRIKVMAKLDIAEKRIPQDGHISLNMGKSNYDIRVSIIPSNGGSERAVLRLLNKNSDGATFNTLGLSEHNLMTINTLIQQPHGIILVTGPTGAGKTTSLYAAIRALNDGKRNILTIEDPVEINMQGIGQMEVNPKIGLTFARGLRAILRQDPDVIMIGEIRDLETAQIAVQSSLTGHMVFSTLHTNSAIGAITRLYDMGIEPFLLSSSLVGLAAQRLVRVLCSHCKQAYTASHRELEWMHVQHQKDATLYRSVGCEQCRHTGYQGRTGVYEIIKVDEKMRELIHNNKGEAEYEAYARKCGPSILQDATEKVLQGITSVEEVMRIMSS